MKRVIAGAVAIGMLLAVGSLLGAAPSQQGSQKKGCSLATMNGTYLFSQTGFQIVDGQQVPFVFTGLDRSNGDGTLTGVNSFSVNGEITRNVTYTGTYTLNPDCTGSSITIDDGTGETAHFDIFVERGGDAIGFLQTDPGYVSGGIERREGR